MNRETFVARYGALYEESPWVAKRAYDGGAVEGDELAQTLRTVVERAGEAAHLELLRAHPDLAGKLEVTLTQASAAEQTGAGLNQCSPDEFEEFQRLNTAYKERFGFPFIMAVSGFDRQTILHRFRERITNPRDDELRTALSEVHKIAGLRLAAMTAHPAVPRVPIARDTLYDLVVAALQNAGADAENASAIAQNMCAAEAAGSESHGVFRLPGTINGIERGKINAQARPRLIDGPKAAVIVDGDYGSATTAYRVALPALAQRAQDQGAAVLCLRNVVHFAAMWPEVEWLAGHRLVSLAMTANLPYVAPHGGRKAMFGTNPIAFAVPRPDGPMAFDFATSAMARGDIMIAARDGRQLPLGIGVDRNGAPTSDPGSILDGAQLAFGDHKGSLIALMVELIAAGVVGDLFSDEADEFAQDTGMPRGGVFILSLDPEQLGGAGALARLDAYLTRLAEDDGVRIPGAQRIRRRKDTGPLMVQSALLETINSLAGKKS